MGAGCTETSSSSNRKPNITCENFEYQLVTQTQSLSVEKSVIGTVTGVQKKSKGYIVTLDDETALWFTTEYDQPLLGHQDCYDKAILIAYPTQGSQGLTLGKPYRWFYGEYPGSMETNLVFINVTEIKITPV